MSKSILLAVALTLGLTGCVYKREIYQGNILPKESIQRLKQGMSREDVEEILGNPVMQSNFDPDTKLNYIEYFKPGKGKPRGHKVMLVFKNDKLIEIKESKL